MAEPTENVESNGRTTGDAAKPERRPSFFRFHPGAKWGLLVIALVLVAGGIFVWRYYSTRESTDDAQIDGDIYPISSRINGHVVAVEVHNNEFVKKGTVLVRIDPTDYQVALDRAQADYATAVAQAQASRVGVPITSVNSSSGISSAQARVQQARAAISAAEKQSLEAQARVKQTQAELHPGKIRPGAVCTTYQEG